MPQLESLEKLFQQLENGKLTNQNQYVQNPHLLIRRQIFQESKTSEFWQKNLPTFYALTNWLSRGNLPFWLSGQQEEAKDQFILFDKFSVISADNNIIFPEIVTEQKFVNLTPEIQKRCLIHELTSVCQKYLPKIYRKFQSSKF